MPWPNGVVEVLLAICGSPSAGSGHQRRLDAWSATVGGEYQIANSPYSVTANYAHAELEDIDLSVDTFTIGFRFSYGGDLQTRERAGADLGRTVAGLGAVAGAF